MDLMLNAIENIEHTDAYKTCEILKEAYDETELERELVEGCVSIKHTNGDKARAAVGVGASLAAGAAADAALAGAAGTMLEAAFAGAAIAGPIGMILGAAASYCAASAAKSVYDAC